LTVRLSPCRYVFKSFLILIIINQATPAVCSQCCVLVVKAVRAQALTTCCRLLQSSLYYMIVWFIMCASCENYSGLLVCGYFVISMSLFLYFFSMSLFLYFFSMSLFLYFLCRGMSHFVQFTNRNYSASCTRKPAVSYIHTYVHANGDEKTRANKLTLRILYMN
jgi:hypothetical protein